MTYATTWRFARSRRWLRYCAQVGEQPLIVGRPSVYLDGGGVVRIGDRFRLACRPVASHLAVGPQGKLEIGHDVSIGCGAAISAYDHVCIGDETQIGPYLVLMDTNFHAEGDQALKHDCKPVIIGRGCRIGTRVTITRGAAIGDGAEILAGSVVSGAIPAGACAAGSRARIIGKAGDAASRWESPVAILPNILLSTLALDVEPNLDDTLIPEEAAVDGRLENLRLALKTQLHLDFDPRVFAGQLSYAAVATLVLRAAGENV